MTCPYRIVIHGQYDAASCCVLTEHADALRAEIERLRGEIVKERLNTEVAAEMVRELKARPQPGEVDAWDAHIKWADVCADAGNFWTYSDGWLTVWDSDANHVMLARLEGERVGGRWLSALAPKPASEAVCPTCDGANRVPSITRPDRFAACPDPFHAPPVCGTCGDQGVVCLGNNLEGQEYDPCPDCCPPVASPRGATEGRE